LYGARLVRAWKPALAVALIALGAIWGGYHVSVMVRLHPYQYIYYNVFTGGVRGASKRFTAIDY
jgi:hypothetical protein